MVKTSKFYDIRAATDDRVLLYIYGDIVGDEYWKWSPDDCCPSDIVKALAEHPNAAVDIHINSGGGDAYAGIAICNILRAHTGKKTVYIDGLAASSASIIAMAGDELIMPRSALVMIHKCWSTAWGCNADEMRKVADTLDTIDKSALSLYMDKAKEGVSEEDMAAKVAAETWLHGEEAAQVWDITLSDVVAAACTSQMFGHYSKAPAGVQQEAGPSTFTPAGAKPPVNPTPQPPPESSIGMEIDLDLMRSFIFTQKQRGDQTNE